MDCFRCLALGSPPFWTFLSNGSILCLDRVSAAGESVYNFFSDIGQCGPAPIAVRDSSDTGLIVGSSLAAVAGVLFAAGLGYYFWKKYFPQLPAEANNNARANIFGFANPNFGFDNPHLPPNQLMLNPEPEAEEFPQLLAVEMAPVNGGDRMQEVDLDADEPAGENLPVYGPEQDPSIIGHSAYGRPLRKTRKYPE